MTEYAGFWIRTGAYLIDAIIINVASGILGLILGGGLGAAFGGMDEAGSAQSALDLFGGIVGLVGAILYFVIMESSPRRGTVGKIAVGIEVSDEHGRQLTIGRATGRYFAKFISAIVMGIGFLMVGWTMHKQGLHDMIAGTLVTKKGTFSDDTDTVDVFR